MGSRRRPRCRDASAGQRESSLLRPRAAIGERQGGAEGGHRLRRLRRTDRRHRVLHRAAGGIHAARHLQQGQPREAGLPGRGAPGARRRGETASGPARGRNASMSEGREMEQTKDTSSRNGSLAIDVEGLTKSFGGKVAGDHFSMKVPRGAIYGFLGPNGSGKTAAIRMICGLLTPDSGRGVVLGHDIAHEAEFIKREVGYMTQKFSLYEDLSIERNPAFIPPNYPLPAR